MTMKRHPLSAMFGDMSAIEISRQPFSLPSSSECGARYPAYSKKVVSFTEKCYNTHQRTPFGGKVG